jgi:uncharacterized protein YjbJ (UPF0337 family)
MDKDRVKGTVEQISGRVKRQAGEWTGDTRTQVEGGLQELKGGVQKTWGEVKDAAREADKASQREIEKSRELSAAERARAEHDEVKHGNR